jgi:hypothetical protein
LKFQAPFPKYLGHDHSRSTWVNFEDFMQFDLMTDLLK